jgi:hypothetical protein
MIYVVCGLGILLCASVALNVHMLCFIGGQHKKHEERRGECLSLSVKLNAMTTAYEAVVEQRDEARQIIDDAWESMTDYLDRPIGGDHDKA